MKAENKGLVRGYGEISLIPWSIDDLWHLNHLITEGSLVYATTFRSVEAANDKIRPEKLEKRPVRLGIRVERVEFHEYSTRLRVFGVIESGVDISSHHTLNLEPGFEISVIRTWTPSDLERINRAVEGSDNQEISILAIEEGEAELFRLFQFGPRSVFSITLGSGKGADTDNRGEFYTRVLQALDRLKGPLIIAGPGFIKDDLAAKYKKTFLERQAPILIETRRSGTGAVQEVIGQGTLERLIGDIQLRREVLMMDEFLKRIAKDEPVAYGRKEITRAIECGAVEKLMIVETSVRDSDVVLMMEAAEQMGSEIIILSSSFEPGERLSSLGGIAALLRYAI